MDLSNRANIFKHLTPGDLENETTQLLFTGLLGKYYDKFIEFCDYVNKNLEQIKSVSCYLSAGEIFFTVEKK